MEKTIESIREKYKKRIPISIALAVIFLALFVIQIFFTNRYYDSTIVSKGIFSGFQSGFSFTLFVFSVMSLFTNLLIIKSDKKLKEQYCKDNDERQALIIQKSSQLSKLILLVILPIGAIISGYFNQTVFITLMIVSVLFAVISIFTQTYYSKKL